MSEATDIAVVTGMGSGRNNINALSSDIVIACGMGPGTASETALALKAGKPVILITEDEEAKGFFKKLSPGSVFPVKDPAEALEVVKKVLAGR